MGLFSKRVKAQKIRSIGEFETMLAEGKPVFVDFWKNDCQPCRVMDGIVDELADEFQNRAVVLKAGLHDVPELFTKFKVRSTPTFVLVTPPGRGSPSAIPPVGLGQKGPIGRSTAKGYGNSPD
jgi:thiol-disulfide isomerase/thioredoxin